MAPRKDLDEVVHVQVKPGETVVYQGHAYGDRATLQLRRDDLDRVHGAVDVLDSGADVPDVGDRR